MSVDTPTYLLPGDERVVAPEDERYNATLIRRVEQTHDLATFWVRFDGEPTPFEPGQYMTIGVYADEKIVQRPYSVASDPSVADSEGYEMYVRLVPVPRFTTLLWRLPLGHRMRMIGPKGRFMLEPDDERTPPVRLDRHGHRAVHLDVPTGPGAGPSTPRRDAQRLFVHGRARVPRAARGLGARRRLTR